MPSGITLHHIGYVVDSIETRMASIAASLGAKLVSKIFDDPLQRSRVAFLTLPTSTPSIVQLELVQPATPDSPVARFIEKGGGLHHFCYEVDDLEAQLQNMKLQNAVLIRSPKPAVAFGGRRIAWVRTRDSLLIEYLERELTISASETHSPVI